MVLVSKLSNPFLNFLQLQNFKKLYLFINILFFFSNIPTEQNHVAQSLKHVSNLSCFYDCRAQRQARSSAVVAARGSVLTISSRHDLLTNRWRHLSSVSNAETGLELTVLSLNTFWLRRRASFPLAHESWAISANQGPDSRFALEGTTKALISKSSWCSILKTHNRLHPILSPTRVCLFFHMHTQLLNRVSTCLMKSGKRKARIVKADYGCVRSNTWIPDRYVTWYSTSNKGRFSNYFWITIPGQVICQNLLMIKSMSGMSFKIRGL